MRAEHKEKLRELEREQGDDVDEARRERENKLKEDLRTLVGDSVSGAVLEQVVLLARHGMAWHGAIKPMISVCNDVFTRMPLLLSHNTHMHIGGRTEGPRARTQGRANQTPSCD